MTTSHESGNQEMQTSVKPSSLVDVANAKAPKVPGTAALGTGLETRGVHAWFGKHHALSNISLDFAAGTVTALIGPSGCGKSTLLRIASNLEANTGGSCSIDRDSIGYVFQDATLMPWRTVARNVELIAELHKLPKTERHQLAAEAIELVGLSGFEDKYPRQLSGGMRMRASLARSLVMKPKVFLFDEPFGALDEITRERLNDELLRLFQHEG